MTSLTISRRLSAVALALAAALIVPLVASQAPPAPVFSGAAPAPDQPLSLWYRRPAADHPLAAPAVVSRQGANAEWVQALPIGNGRLGAMVFGGVVHERLQLNEDTIWAGGPYDPVNPDAKAALPDVRQLIAEGRYKEAADLTTQKVLAKPLGEMPYETLGDLSLTFPDVSAVTDYRRDLNLDEATAHVSYTADGVRFNREVFASAPDQVIVVRLTADRPGRVDVRVGLQSPLDATIAVSGDTLILRGRNGDGHATTADGTPITAALTVQARVQVLPEGGAVTADGDALVVRGANAATLLIAAATSYVNYHDVGGNPERRTGDAIAAARAKGVAALRRAHVADYQKLFRRVSLDLGRTSSADLPTDERIRAFPDGGDPALAALYFQYGRYLLISSSRPGGQPANLQGLWNDSMNPPWGSKYTININTEMNYWPASNDQSRRVPRSAGGDGHGSDPDRRAHGRRDVRRRRLGRAPQHRPLARHGAHRRRGLWHLADRRRLAHAGAVGSVPVHRGSRLPAAHLSGAARRGPVLPRHSRRRAHAPLAGHLAVALAGESASARRRDRRRPDDGRGDPARSVRRRLARVRDPWHGRRAARALGRDARAAGAAADGLVRSAPGMARGLGHAGARHPSSSRVAPVRLVPWA